MMASFTEKIQQEEFMGTGGDEEYSGGFIGFHRTTGHSGGTIDSVSLGIWKEGWVGDRELGAIRRVVSR